MWPKVRGTLIALILLCCVVEAVPIPALRERHLNRSLAREEADRWVGVLEGLGVHMSSDELLGQVLTVSKEARAARAVVLGPWRAFSRQFKLAQAWGLFAFTDPHPGRLVLEGRAKGGEWTLLFKAPSTGDERLGRVLFNRRMRGVWDDAGDRPKPGRLYDRWVTWVAKDVFEHRPDVDVVRVRFDRLSVSMDGPGATAPEEPVHRRERHREDYR
jgi:hypothetical protein